MMADIQIDEAGYIHVTWSMHVGHPGGFGMKYRRSTYPEDITQWNSVEYPSSVCASYAMMRTNGSIVYIFNRPGSHGSGYHMWYKDRNATSWNEKTIVAPRGSATYNTYANIGEFFTLNGDLVCPWVHYYLSLIHI